MRAHANPDNSIDNSIDNGIDNGIDNVIDLADQAMFLGEKACGATFLLQCA